MKLFQKSAFELMKTPVRSSILDHFMMRLRKTEVGQEKMYTQDRDPARLSSLDYPCDQLTLTVSEKTPDESSQRKYFWQVYP
ncbi:hypothetical protein AAES_39384 [Amazona aestiva]|uniref:Uncharacterized protein n=1 Tax=Amazona aestiva TaxID=12930 RepID=A0A0Q3TYG3_AMAAE|nr:hypothetical protein AAES_39384 [Amazona aestiva]